MPSPSEANSAPLLLETRFSVLESGNMRLDVFLRHLFPNVSRSHINAWISQGDVMLADKLPKSATKIKNKEEIRICASLPAPIQEDQPEDIDLHIVYEDDDLLIVNKPPGLVTHPGAGNPANTLLNGLLAYREEQRFLPRAGIIHRLDKDTSGLLLVAKDDGIRLALQKLLARHQITREYLALVEGRVISGGLITRPIGRDQRHRLRMRAFTPEQAPAYARAATTEYRVQERFRHHTLLRIGLKTGRTHQIRCHLAAIGFRVCSDPLYGRKKHFRSAEQMHKDLQLLLAKTQRQMLHAHHLAFIHPRNHKPLDIRADMPADMAQLLALLRHDQEAINERKDA